jgi:transcriptional regulator
MGGRRGSDTVGRVYVPSVNRVDEPSEILGLLRSVGLGHLVSSGSEGLDATVLPFLVDDDLTTVRAHFARANPHWRSVDGRAGVMIVPVTDAYVSPSWYPSKADDPRVVPTWNYEVVHVHGTIRIVEEAAALGAIVRDLTDHHEARRSAHAIAPTWSVDDAPADFIARQLRAIVGLEMTIERVEAKRKLSQNRTADDREGVIDGLMGDGDHRARAIAAAMVR